jgi:hypothetical protein
LDWDGVLRTAHGDVMGYCSIGAPVSRLFDAISEHQTTTKASHIQEQNLTSILSLYASSRYILWPDRSSTPTTPRFNIVLKKGAEPTDLLIAWWQALFHAQDDSTVNQNDLQSELQGMEKSLTRAKELFSRYEKGLRDAGWDLNNGALETGASTRVVFEES